MRSSFWVSNRACSTERDGWGASREPGPLPATAGKVRCSRCFSSTTTPRSYPRPGPHQLRAPGDLCSRGTATRSQPWRQVPRDRASVSGTSTLPPAVPRGGHPLPPSLSAGENPGDEAVHSLQQAVLDAGHWLGAASSQGPMAGRGGVSGQGRDQIPPLRLFSGPNNPSCPHSSSNLGPKLDTGPQVRPCGHLTWATDVQRSCLCSEPDWTVH